jgi:hypothetical protein
MSNQTNNIMNPKPCNFGCGTRIYWDNSSKSYLEVFTKQKHICKNRSANNNVSKLSTQVNKPNYFNKYSKQPKPKMSNSLELISGPIESVQKKYEILSDIVTEYNGKVHGSQSHVIPHNANAVSLIVYYEVPNGQRDEIKQKFNSFVKNLMVYNNHH